MTMILTTSSSLNRHFSWKRDSLWLLVSLSILSFGSQLSPVDILSATDDRRLSEAATVDIEKMTSDHLKMFSPSNKVQALGPTVFPKPAPEGLQPVIKPRIGQHRPDQDAVIAFAAEYKTDNYVVFVESLRVAGFTGDIVLVISELDLANVATRQYLEHAPNLVVYVPSQTCYNAEGEEVDSAKGGIRTCRLHGLYGTAGGGKGVEDPRPPRTVANIRYEFYWILSSHYDPHSWILLVDARDTYFQEDPFAHVPRRSDESGRSGLLYFFGENVEATRIGLSKMNNKWIRNAYGDFVGDALSKKPTICSGASMGEQVAIDQYLRAMVTEGDETGTVIMGSDQGYHNRLYYTSKLRHVDAIHSIVVFDQGSGIVNNMGAIRTKPLEEWGNGQIVDRSDDKKVVKNWDGTVSAVVHQYDRHKELGTYFMGRILRQELRPRAQARLKAA